MTRLFTIQAIWVLALLSGGSIGLAATSPQGAEPAIVAPGSDADIAAGAAEDSLRDSGNIAHPRSGDIADSKDWSPLSERRRALFFC